MLEDFEFRLRVRAESQDPSGLIMTYLKSKNTPFLPKDMAMIALTSFWLPFAYQAAGQSTHIDLESHVRSCLHRLKLQEQYLLDLLEQSSKAKSAIRATPVEPVIPQVASASNDGEHSEWFNPFGNSK